MPTVLSRCANLAYLARASKPTCHCTPGYRKYIISRVLLLPNADCLHPVSGRIHALHIAIKSIPDTVDFSDPSTFVELPFPSPLPAPTRRFQTSKRDGVPHFRYMGRTKFAELKNYTKGEAFVDGTEDIYLYGSSGSGKSHILAALVFQLIREGKRVLYVPDCRDLLSNFHKTIQAALLCAFYDDAESLAAITSASSVDDLFKFWNDHTDRYLVVDQLNVLEVDPDSDSLKATKEGIYRQLNEMRFAHRYIYSASANEKANRDVDLKQAPIKVFSMYGGMDEVRHNLISSVV